MAITRVLVWQDKDGNTGAVADNLGIEIIWLTAPDDPAAYEPGELVKISGQVWACCREVIPVNHREVGLASQALTAIGK